MIEQTLIILKPDAVIRGLIGKIIDRFEQKGFRIVGMKMTRISPELAARHYEEHREKPFYRDLVDYITSGPVILAVIEGPKAISVVRSMVGATDASLAQAGTIRGDFGLSKRFNLIHASDSEDSARREINLFFSPSEVYDYKKESEKWIW